MHLICGEALYDVFVETRDAPLGSDVPLRAVAGGSPFNVAVGMARLGAQVAFASDIARDPLGGRLVSQLAAERVDTRFLRRAATASALAIIATGPGGRPSYSFFGLDQATYCPPIEAVEEADGRITGVHIGSIATVLPNSARSLLDLARRFAGRALVSLDPNVRLSIVRDPAAWRDMIENIRFYCQVIKISDEDIAALYGDANPEAICRSLLTERTSLVVLTRGPHGATMFTELAGAIEIPPVETSVVDTVGAGDSFMAALLSALVQSATVSSAAIASLTATQLFALGSFAARAASMTCSRRGPVLPTALELEHSDPIGMNVAS